ncbi:PadR family transcriptional regulator [Demequina capsici]|uniref:PadR family transcriptional regulator n=1 Tax=Demequina capsici TaxID=3075620 RepID=A0AA96F804_9MICO|nr:MULTISPECIES: PadR family transcriptional regulator [unclassified Demequina]WNM24878.1 PadR family transcriptional regulator [Demequina sp. OYTSA14]WNM27785.1 PadR family transcriptional regulator [Demequina sp. PMTSA13]
MGSTFRPGSRGGSGASNPADAMWDAMQQIRSEFDKRVGTRMGRGDVRAAVLALLAEQPMHGYQIIREIESRTDGRWKPSPGSVYPTLQMLADEGLVTVETAQDRKIYSLTEEGREVAADVADSVPWESTGSWEGLHLGPVPKAGVDLAQAAAQAARFATEEQQAAVAEVLNEARRKIYSILAKD